MKRKVLYVLIAFVVFSIIVSHQEPCAAPYYEGKVINIIVGFPVGGGYDRITRIVAKHLPKHLPGKPVVMVQNMPGAGSMIVANTLFNLTKPDGLTFGIFNRGMPFAQLLKAEGVKFDLRKFAWIGSAAVETATFALRADLPFKTVDDILKTKKPLFIGSAGGPADSATQFVILLREFAKIDMKIVNYPGSPEAMLALEQKEVDGRGGAFSSFKPFLGKGVVRLWIRGRVSEPGIESLPVDEDLVADKLGKTIMAMRSTPDYLGRGYVAPPGTPQEIMSLLSDAFAKLVKDPEAKEDAKKAMMELAFVPPEECRRLVNYVLNQPDDIVKEFSKYVKF